MPTVRDFVALVESLAPPHFAMHGDPVGLHVGDLTASVSKLCVALDCTQAGLDFAILKGCQAMLVHHPVIYDPIKNVLEQDRVGALMRKAIKHDVAVMAAHTNLDTAFPGINDTLASLLKLNEVRPYGLYTEVPLWLLTTYCPASHVASVISAASGAGAGVLGHYTACAFTSAGTGQFTPSEAATPYAGKKGRPNQVDEVRIEMQVADPIRLTVYAAVKAAHPYEEPLIAFLAAADTQKAVSGRIGHLAKSMSFAEFQGYVNSRLGCSCQVWAPPSPGRITRVAVTGGAACFDWEGALHAGADVFLTGEARLKNVIAATEQGMGMVQAGHYETEHPGIVEFGRTIAHKLALDCHVYEPVPGAAGRSL